MLNKECVLLNNKTIIQKEKCVQSLAEDKG